MNISEEEIMTKFGFGFGIPFTEYIETYRHLQVSLVCKTKYIVNGTKHEGEMHLNALNLMFAPDLDMTPIRERDDTLKHENKSTIHTSKSKSITSESHWKPEQQP